MFLCCLLNGGQCIRAKGVKLPPLIIPSQKIDSHFSVVSRPSVVSDKIVNTSHWRTNQHCIIHNIILLSVTVIRPFAISRFLPYHLPVVVFTTTTAAAAAAAALAPTSSMDSSAVAINKGIGNSNNDVDYDYHDNDETVCASNNNNHFDGAYEGPFIDDADDQQQHQQQEDTPLKLFAYNNLSDYVDIAEDAMEETESTISTPTHRPSATIINTKPSRFVFVSDQKNVPNVMKRLQEHTIKRRREVLSKLHDIDCQMAQLLGKFAQEKMDMELAISDTFERTVAQPLVSTIDRLSIQRESSDTRMVGVTKLERRLNYLDAQMVHHIHVTLSDLRRDELDRWYDDLHQDMVSEIHVETAKYDKVEAGIVRRYEHVAGDIAQQFHGEGATRRATMAFIQQTMDTTIPQKQTKRLERTLSQIAQLRARLQQERADRQVADQKILDTIVSTTEAMKRALMTLVCDDGEPK
jgi:hypothetical protein